MAAARGRRRCPRAANGSIAGAPTIARPVSPGKRRERAGDGRFDRAGPEKLEELLAKQAILELLHAYSRAVDRQDFELLASLYTPTAPTITRGSTAGPPRATSSGCAAR